MTAVTENAADAVSAEAKAVTGRPAPKPMIEGAKGHAEQVALYIFVGVPFLAVLAIIPLMEAVWGWSVPWTSLFIAAGFYIVSGMGITVGFHRYFTHGSFKAKRALKIAMAIAGSMAIEGQLIQWVANHRRHHAFSDVKNDPHSPWRYGNTIGALLKGLGYAHVVWMFNVDQTNRDKFAPDLQQDKDLVLIDQLFPVWVAVSLLGPALIGGLVSMSLAGAVSAFFWGSLVRIFLLHHVTWSINSICHTIGRRPFAARDKSTNFALLAILSFGESWHNSHHADPTCARHGVLRWQFDSSARLIRWFEAFGWVWDVRWPTPERLQKMRLPATT